ncbi:MAG: PspC domain-containing protein [Coriobacteriia bacterium]|nr:PspC domain-containing protein [Coriobacteriia bacterium]
MTEHDRRSEWQIFGAVALIALGVMLFLNQVGGPWWTMIREAFRFAAKVAWPLILVGIGVLLLVSAKRGGAILGDASGRRLLRSRSERMVAGVLGGLGAYFGIDPTWLRIIYVVFAVMTGFWIAVLLYLVAMVLVPEEPRPGVEPPQWPQAGQPQAPTWVQHPTGSTETVQAPPPAPPAPPVPPVR